MASKPFMKRWAERYTPARPNPWVERKLVVGVVLGLAVWAIYVGVGRVCVPAIQQRQGAGFSRGTGIGILVPFIILWVMFAWSYIMVITTPPGFARDVVPSELGASKEERSFNSETFPLETENPLPSGQGTGHQFSVVRRENNAPNNGAQQMSTQTNTQPNTQVPTVVPSLPPANSPTARIPRPQPYVHYGVRWCEHCQLAKPNRTHHCRQCGTCVLQFDHHCAWVGQCVGWKNHAIFVVFNLWAGLFCCFNAGILIASLASTTKVDVQKAVLAGISGFLGIFTLFAMFPTHVVLILTGKSTIDTFRSRSQKATEQAVLQQEFHSKFWVNKEMRRTMKLWDDEYGGVEVDERWKWGTWPERWCREMGSNWLGWILPIGRAQGNGVDFPANPRFGPNGEWLPMRDWPETLAATRHPASAV